MKTTTLIAVLLLTVNLYSKEETEIDKAYYSSYQLESQQRYVEAIKALAPVSREFPNGYTVNYRKGWLSYQNGSYADALSYFKVALSQFPSSMEVRKAIVLVDVAKKNWKKVEADARSARGIDYYNLDVTYWQVVALRLLGQVDTAKKVAEEITLLYPTNTSFLIELVQIHLAKKDINKAKEYLSSVLILDPYNPTANSLSKKIYSK
jgi:tetratricopeptide (TPR) repeat protein